MVMVEEEIPMNEICVVTAYFGVLPGSFGPWLRSCEANPDVDFLIVGDCRTPELPENVSHVWMTLEEMRDKCRRKVKPDAVLGRPYKCCDYKPVYGEVFDDLLEGYLYWGHCDMDMVFGDLAKFLNRIDFKRYDKVYPLGHLSLYRNVPEVNVRYRLPGARCGSFEEVFSSDRPFAFDEQSGIDDIYRGFGFPFYEGRDFADISSIYRRFRLALDDPNHDRQMFYWDRGKAYRAYIENGLVGIDEFAYVHFKKRSFKRPEFNIEECDSFSFGPLGYIERPGGGTPGAAEIDRVNPYHGRAFERAERLGFGIARLRGSVSSRFGRLFHGGI